MKWKWFLLCILLNLSLTAQTYKITYHFLYDSTGFNTSLIHDDLIFLQKTHDELNKGFNGIAKFDIFQIELNQYSDNLWNLYTDYIHGGTKWDDLILSYGVDCTINIFIVRNSDPIDGIDILGFTPQSENYYDYQNKYPLYNGMAISYSSLSKYNLAQPLIHEMGHFFGLKHPWELTNEELISFNLQNADNVCTNYMNYNCYTNMFTEEQKKYIKYFQNSYRKYLAQ